MSGPFKMKGSPMKRNFGIGASPAKTHTPDHKDEGPPEKRGKRQPEGPPKKGKRLPKTPNVKEIKLPTFRKGDVSISQYSKSGEKRYNIVEE